MRPKPRRRRNRFRSWSRLFLAMLILSCVGVSVAIGALLVIIGPTPAIDQLERYRPPQVTRIYDRTGRVEIARLMYEKEDREVVSVKDIPQVLIQAFLAAEDEDFYKHFGIDFTGVVAAVVDNLRSWRFDRGFSTITMQLPRNLPDLTTTATVQRPSELPRLTGREQTIKRKLRDIYLALQIEKRYSKDQILEFYLNQVYLGQNGSHQAHGIQSAARVFFDKSLNQLTLEECASLAALPKAPHFYSSNLDRLKYRRDWVLDRMQEQRYIDREACERARNVPVRFVPRKADRVVAPYFVDFLKAWLPSVDPRFAGNALLTNGYVIHSTVDLEMQQIVEEELQNGLVEAEKKWHNRKYASMREQQELGADPAEGGRRLAKITRVNLNEDTTSTIDVAVNDYKATIALPEVLPWYTSSTILLKGEYVDVAVKTVDKRRRTFTAALYDENPIMGAALVLDAKTGDVLAMSGGYDFYKNQEEWHGWVNRAFRAARQVGSCFKPVVFALALDQGLGPDTTIVDEPRWFGKEPYVYSPRNYEKQHYGPTTLLTALEHSRNVVTVILYDMLLRRMGTGLLGARIQNFDLMPNTYKWDFRANELSTALGSVSITPLELAAAYSPFVNGGFGVVPRGALEVTDLDLRAVREFNVERRQLINPVAAYQMLYMMRSVVLRGTGKPAGEYFARLRAQHPERVVPQICGKTGTTNDCTEAWFAGYTPDLVVVVYVGFDAPRSLGPEMTGRYVALPAWIKIVDRILAKRNTRDWQVAFKEPPGVQYYDMNADTGETIADAAGAETEPADTVTGVPFRRPGMQDNVVDETIEEAPDDSGRDPYHGFKQ